MFVPTEKTTSPTKHYTVETLNNYLKNPFREDKAQAEKAAQNQSAQNGQNAPDGSETENDEEDYRAIFEGLELGTEATRTGIIENAKQSEYIALNKDVYTILPKGRYLIETLSLLGISMDKYKTSQVGQALKKVYKGEISIRASLRLAQNEIAEVFARGGTAVNAPADMDIGLYGDEIGVCPLCGKKVVRGRFNYGCTGYADGCKFRIPLSLCKRPIPISAAKALLESGNTAKLDGFMSKNGKPFSAILRLSGDKVEFQF